MHTYPVQHKSILSCAGHSFHQWQIIETSLPMLKHWNKMEQSSSNLKKTAKGLRCSCNGVPSVAAHPSVKHRKQVNIAAGTVLNSSLTFRSSTFPKRVRVTTPSKYMQSTNRTTAQKSTRSPVKTPWIMSLSLGCSSFLNSCLICCQTTWNSSWLLQESMWKLQA